MIIRCGNCGFLRAVKYEGTAEEIEADIDKTVQEGWRYVRIYNGYKCPNCEEDPYTKRQLENKEIFKK